MKEATIISVSMADRVSFVMGTTSVWVDGVIMSSNHLLGLLDAWTAATAMRTVARIEDVVREVCGRTVENCRR